MHLQLSTGTLTATTLLQKVHLQLSSGTLTATTLLQKVHLQLSTCPLTATTHFAKCAAPDRHDRATTNHSFIEGGSYVDTFAATFCHSVIIFIVMLCRVCFAVRRSRLRAEATCVACIVGLRCVAAIFTSLRCRMACRRLDANVPCGRASACSFAMLMLLCPASEKAALHSWPDNASLACLHASIVLYILVS